MSTKKISSIVSNVSVLLVVLFITLCVAKLVFEKPAGDYYIDKIRAAKTKMRKLMKTEKKTGQLVPLKPKNPATQTELETGMTDGEVLV
jgi:hypothetical protein